MAGYVTSAMAFVCFELFVSMAYTLIKIQSYSFIISKPKASFQFSIFKESFLHGIYFYIGLPLFLPSFTFETATTTFKTPIDF